MAAIQRKLRNMLPILYRQWKSNFFKTILVKYESKKWSKSRFSDMNRTNLKKGKFHLFNFILNT